MNSQPTNQPPEAVSPINEMDKAIRCLALELPAEVWEDVNKRWQRVKATPPATVIKPKDASRNIVQLSNVPNQEGISNEWLLVWNEIEKWYGDIQKRETGAEFLKRMQKQFPIATVIQPLQWVDSSISVMQLNIGRLEVNCFDEDSEMSIRVGQSRYQSLSVDEAKELASFIVSHIKNETEANPDESTPPNQLPMIEVEDQLKAWVEIVGIVQGDHGEVAFMETAKELLKKYGPIKAGPTPTNQPKEISDELSGIEVEENVDYRNLNRLYGELNILVRLRAKLAKEEILEDGKWITIDEKRDKVWEEIQALQKLEPNPFKAGYAASERQSSCRKVLDELVRLKILKDELDKVPQEKQDQKFVNDYAEYVVAKKIAWKKAKEVLLNAASEGEEAIGFVEWASDEGWIREPFPRKTTGLIMWAKYEDGKEDELRTTKQLYKLYKLSKK